MQPVVVDTHQVELEVCATMVIRKVAVGMVIAQILQFLLQHQPQRLIRLPHQHQLHPHHPVELHTAAGVLGAMPALVVVILQVEVVACAVLIGQPLARLLEIVLISQLLLHQRQRHPQCLLQALCHQHRFLHLDHRQHLCQFLHQHLVVLEALSCLDILRTGVRPSSGGMRTCLAIV